MKLRIIEHTGKGKEARAWVITQEEFLIGRGADCDLRLTDKTISRHHCTIRISSDEVTLADLGSVNGTFVNGQRVRSQITLASGDALRLGDLEFQVALGLGDVFGPEFQGQELSDQTMRQRKSKEEPPHPGSP